jgi:hypothetical protein
MKSVGVVLALLVATCNAFSPLLATRAVGKTVPVAAKKPVVAAKKPVAVKTVVKAAPKPVAVKKPVVIKKAAPKPVAVKKPIVAKKVAPKPVAVKKPVVVKAAASKPKFSFGAKSKGAVKAPFSLPKVAAKPKAKINIQGPKTTRVKKNVPFVYDDGLSELERKQRKTLPIFLTGSAKSQKDVTAIRPELASGDDEYYFSPYDTTLATLGAFVIISLIIKAGSPGL